MNLQLARESKSSGQVSIMDYQNLFIALIILVCLLIVLFAVYVLNHHVKRDRKLSTQEQDVEIQANLHAAGIVPENGSDDSRLSRLTVVAPSIELLPEIKTNKDRAEDWLDRRDSRATNEDIGLEPITMLGANDRSGTESNCTAVRDEGGANATR